MFPTLSRTGTCQCQRLWLEEPLTTFAFSCLRENITVNLIKLQDPVIILWKTKKLTALSHTGLDRHQYADQLQAKTKGKAFLKVYTLTKLKMSLF